MRPRTIHQLRLIHHPELRKGIGAWASRGRRVIHRKIRKANVCPVMQVSLPGKKKISMVLTLFLGQAPYLSFV